MSSKSLDPEFLEAHRKFMRAVARSLLYDDHLAEDVVQQACVAAHEHPRSSEPALRSWLAGVVRKLALKTAGREARRAHREPDSASPETRHEAGREFQLQHHVAAALAGLPEPYRSTIYLRYYRELGPGAIAARLRTSPETVKTRLRKGLELLRRDLDMRCGGERHLWAAPLASLFEGH